MNANNTLTPGFSQFWRLSEINPTRGVLLRERIEQDTAEPLPLPVLQWPAATRPLPTVSEAQHEMWSQRSSTRAFAPEAIDAHQLSHVLWPFARRVSSPEGWRHLASGGAKYPLLLHWLWFNAPATLQTGAGRYAYDPEQHGLVPTGTLSSWEQAAPLLGVTMDDAQKPSGVLVITARPEAQFAKYGERAGRFMLLEAGSYLGALQAQAAQLKLATLIVGAFDDRAVLNMVGAQPQDLAVSVALIGHHA